MAIPDPSLPWPAQDNWQWHYEPWHAKPYRCPICEGHGLVPSGFYLHDATVETYAVADAAPEKCRACDGKGIIWG